METLCEEIEIAFALRSRWDVVSFAGILKNVGYNSTKKEAQC